MAVKIVNHAPGKEQIRDIRVLRETLFSTALLHPNIVVVRLFACMAHQALLSPAVHSGVAGVLSDSLQLRTRNL